VAVHNFQVANFLGWRRDQKDPSKDSMFVGCHPVSMEGNMGNKNYQLLAKREYMVSWKADGTR